MSTASYTVFIKGQQVDFQSDLTPVQVKSILGTLTSSFAQDLYAKFRRLSDKQYSWAVKLCEDHLSQQQKYAAQNYDFNGIVDSILSAQENGLKRIKLRFHDLIVKPSKNFFASRDGKGRLYVLSATETQESEWGTQPKYLGWITRTTTSLKDDEIISILEDVSEDPMKAARLYGQQTGQCCCCGRELTRKDSIALGIGPICAERYGWIR